MAEVAKCGRWNAAAADTPPRAQDKTVLNSKLKPEPERKHEHESKQRRCLKCRKLFTSDWLGERICPHCKKLARREKLAS